LVAPGLEAGDSPDVHSHHPFPGIRFRQNVAYSCPNVHVGAVPGDCTDDVMLTQRDTPRGPIMMLSPRHKRTSRGCAPSQRERTYHSKSDVGCHPQTEERSGGSLWVLPLVTPRLEAGDSPDVHMHHAFPGIRFRQVVAFPCPNVHVGAVPGDCTDDVTLTQRDTPRGPVMMLPPRHKRTSRGCAPSQRERTYHSKSDVGCHPQTEERSGGSLWVPCLW